MPSERRCALVPVCLCAFVSVSVWLCPCLGGFVLFVCACHWVGFAHSLAYVYPVGHCGHDDFQCWDGTLSHSLTSHSQFFTQSLSYSLTFSNALLACHVTSSALSRSLPLPPFSFSPSPVVTLILARLCVACRAMHRKLAHGKIWDLKSISHFPTLGLFLSHSLSHSLTPSLSHPLILSPFHALTRSLSHSYSRTLTPSLSYPLALLSKSAMAIGIVRTAKTKNIVVVGALVNSDYSLKKKFSERELEF